MQEHRNSVSIGKSGTCHILCLGESTTADLRTQEPYPGQLEEILNKSDIGVKFSVINKGVVGITTSGIVGYLEDNLDKYKPALVITMMGINDSGFHIYLGENAGSKTPLFLKNLKVYKLFNILSLRFKSKINENTPKNRYYPYDDALLKDGLGSKAGNCAFCLRAGGYYKSKGMYAQAKLLFKKALELNPGNKEACLELGNLYRLNGEYDRAEGLLLELSKIEPENKEVNFELGWLYRDEGKVKLAKAALQKALLLDSKNIGEYLQIGDFYAENGDFPEAERIFKKAVQLDPGNYNTYYELADFYRDIKNYPAAEEVYQKALALNPRAVKVYEGLGYAYLAQKDYDRSEAMFRKVLSFSAKLFDERACSGLIKLYLEKGETNTKQFRDLMQMKGDYYNADTIYNYRRLKAILDARGIKLVCVQYPVRSVEPLKRIFGRDENVQFVDNENTFKSALKKYGEKEYFVDMFGGDFGHCTTKGNRLLAENIAEVILKEIKWHE
ncbi:MAG: tetratricopeptide repeat protein [Candidatus Omnitrophica bacterium]|nr:tetratricopeptide repeat protein [Candidatus Omnitrophota bacterium]